MLIQAQPYYHCTKYHFFLLIHGLPVNIQEKRFWEGFLSFLSNSVLKIAITCLLRMRIRLEPRVSILYWEPGILLPSMCYHKISSQPDQLWIVSKMKKKSFCCIDFDKINFLWFYLWLTRPDESFHIVLRMLNIS